MQAKSPLRYFFLVFGLAVPFWLVGGRELPPPVSLPASALGAFVPMTAAAVLSYRDGGLPGLKQILRKAWDYRQVKHKTWWALALLLAPAIYLFSYLIMRLTRLPLPERIKIPLRTAPGLFLMFLIGDTGEELGWTGYATDPLVERWGPAKGGLILGVIWAIWHAIPFVQTRHPARWVIWQSLKTVAMRVVLVWIYHKSGKSVLAANLYHVTDNLSWSLFPNSRSHYHPLVTGAVTWLVAGLILMGAGSRGRERRTPVRHS